MIGTGLLTDAYELTVAGSYLRRGMMAPGTFSLFVRQLGQRPAFGTFGRDGQVFNPGRWRD